MTDEQMYHALEALRNEVLTGQEGLKAEFHAVAVGMNRAFQTGISAVADSTDKIDKQLERLNSRTRKAELSIARLKLVVFTIGGTVGAALVEYLLLHSRVALDTAATITH